MRWGEVHRLSLILLADPSSQIGAAVRGWTHPITREDMVLRDTLDRFAKVNFKRPEPYPRPWHAQPKKVGSGSVSVEEFEAMKRRAAGLN